MIPPFVPVYDGFAGFLNITVHTPAPHHGTLRNFLLANTASFYFSLQALLKHLKILLKLLYDFLLVVVNRKALFSLGRFIRLYLKGL